MSIRFVHNQPLRLSNPHLPSPTHLPPRISISCLNKSPYNNNNNNNPNKPIRNPRKTKKPSPISTSDAHLARSLAAEAGKMRARAEEREAAMRRSAEMLFDELCRYMAMGAEREEVKSRWRRMEEDERMGLVAAFVGDWGGDFQPLSRRGVMELIEEFVGREEEVVVRDQDSVAGFGMDGLRRLIGFVSG